LKCLQKQDDDNEDKSRALKLLSQKLIYRCQKDIDVGLSLKVEHKVFLVHRLFPQNIFSRPKASTREGRIQD